MSAVTHKWDIAPKAIFKILGTILLTYLLYKTFTISLLILLGLFVAISLEPTIRRLERLGFKRGLAIGTMGLIMAIAVTIFCFYALPSIFSQLTVLIQALPSFKNGLLTHLPGDAGFLKFAQETFESPKMPSTEVLMGYATTLLSLAGEAISEVFLVLIFSLYLLADGARAYRWINDFFSAPIRVKLQATCHEAALVVHGYVAAQVITSIGSGIFLYVLLMVLNVPAALTLAVIAAIMDIVPLIGFFLAVIPATLLAFTVSPVTGFIVFGAYGIYHVTEIYFIAPLIYGKRMNVSSLVVLIAILVAGLTGGILAAITILPIVASYPIIERIWLAKWLGRSVISKHADSSGPQPIAPQVEMWREKLLNLHGPSSGMPNREMQQIAKKVLVIEDDADIRSMLKEILDTEGYVTVSAANGRDGLQILHQDQTIGLILLDMMMPVMNGRSFLDLLKSDPLIKHIPVVFLSGSVDQSDTHGAEGVLRKPAEIETVLNTVAKYYASSVS